MKQPYRPIDVPACLCGRAPSVMNRVTNHELPFTILSFSECMNEDGTTDHFICHVKRKPLWLCVCECGNVAGGSTKRAAVEAFGKLVEI